jgi:hypothetical protein
VCVEARVIHLVSTTAGSKLRIFQISNDISHPNTVTCCVYIVSVKTESENTAEKSVVRVIILQANTMGRGTQWRSWLRHCATSRKVAGSIPHVVIRIFH